MAIYECNKCGMSVKTSCAKCDEDLIDDVLKLDNGSEVQISKCPNNHGKIKSPLCCGEVMNFYIQRNKILGKDFSYGKIKFND